METYREQGDGRCRPHRCAPGSGHGRRPRGRVEEELRSRSPPSRNRPVPNPSSQARSGWSRRSGSKSSRPRRWGSPAGSSSTGRWRPPLVPSRRSSASRCWRWSGPRSRVALAAMSWLGSVEDLSTELVQPDGSITPVFIPSARAYILPMLRRGVGAVAVRRHRHFRRRAHRPLSAVCPPGMPGPLVSAIAGIRVPLPRIEVRLGRRVLRRSGTTQPRPLRGRGDRRQPGHQDRHHRGDRPGHRSGGRVSPGSVLHRHRHRGSPRGGVVGAILMEVC